MSYVCTLLKSRSLIAALLCCLTCAHRHAAVAVDSDDILIDDFESGSYGHWEVVGEAFGTAPARGTLPNQMEVSGYRGIGLVNTFLNGDKTTGEATSTKFVIRKSHLAFLIGGGPHRDSLGIELLISGKVVRSATGPESESLEWANWSVEEFRNQTAQLRIFDRATEGWGHICIDHIVQTDTPPDRFDLDGQLALYRASTDYLNEPLRPQVHFTPEINWMNDPNGLVFHDGEYHLFYQFNPAGLSWGHMSWGHAVSRDLLHWEHLPLAIPEENGIMAFSGCCVVDRQNTSGFGTAANPPLVAVYTGHGHGKQVQNLAWSTDRGRSWTRYEKNPVLDVNNPDFRDPRVFWHAPSKRWVMVVSLAVEKVLVFYNSTDLKHWEEVSRFGPAGAKNKPNWECPDLFELPVEGHDGKKLWVLEADMGSGSIAGGSGGEYFVGHFDGKAFTAIQDARWVDYGRDFYAPISWSDIPESDGRRIWIGWMNNWETCLVPTSPWRSSMSIPRSLSLRQINTRGASDGSVFTLVQRPVQELQKLILNSKQLETTGITWPPAAVTTTGELSDQTFIINLKLHPGNARSCGLRIRTGENEYTEIGYDREPAAVYVDRRNSGIVDFHPAFAGRHEAPARLIDGAVAVQILVDRSSVEVFINDGEAVITDCVFPSGRTPVVEVFAGDTSATVTGTLNFLKSAVR
ncbi:MAG: glycoside hydrolase family 32 protein [Planctomyces sp.]|nr:glycoside hydrolase family 32 protein [Planctomyces sp.]